MVLLYDIILYKYDSLILRTLIAIAASGHFRLRPLILYRSYVLLNDLANAYCDSKGIDTSDFCIIKIRELGKLPKCAAKQHSVNNTDNTGTNRRSRKPQTKSHQEKYQHKRLLFSESDIHTIIVIKLLIN